MTEASKAAVAQVVPAAPECAAAPLKLTMDGGTYTLVDYLDSKMESGVGLAVLFDEATGCVLRIMRPECFGNWMPVAHQCDLE